MSKEDIAWKKFQVAMANSSAVERRNFLEYEKNQRIKQLWVLMSLTSTQKRKRQSR
jgi:hypothetical protein